MIFDHRNLSHAWAQLAHSLVKHGAKVSPRGKETREIRNVSLRFHGRNNIILSEQRDLNYRFMVAEWLWMAAGRNDAGSITRFNKQLAQFSDDGIRFAGAYGPMIKDQLAYVIKNLKSDSTSRQALLTIWRPSPGPSRDIPCTVALQFFLRDDLLHVTATMRSSDVWLGVPYDAFNFSQIGASIAGAMGVDLGEVVMNLGSSHVYAPNYDGAASVIFDDTLGSLPAPLVQSWPPAAFMNVFLDGDGTEEWITQLAGDWKSYVPYARALMAKNKADALELLRG